ncbi:AAA family ATPase [Nostoc sp.]|uniref:AAA family ATPase n=1 Tax=Nostoc sp. TaxID=1180 RepID=UPI002FFACAB3
MPKKNSPLWKTDSSAKNNANSPITGFRISNFKAFADTQYIPIRPLTLIYGANSSGKSSVLHSLLLAHHAITNEGELDVYRTEAGGDSVDLGGFGQYVHKRDRTRLVEWAIDLDPSNINLSDKGLGSLLEPIKKLTVGVGIGMHSSGNGGIKVRSFFLEADGERVLNMSSRRKGRLQLDRLDHKHRIVSLLIEAIIEANTFNLKITPQDEEEIEEVINLLVPEITAQVSRLLPINIQAESSPQGISEHIIPGNSQHRQDTLADVMRLFIPYRLNDIVGAITQTVEHELEKLRYLGPFRTYPPRHFAFSQQQDANWQAGGGYAWDVLLNNPEVRQKVNAWLGDSNRMKTPYELRVRTLLPDSHLEDELYSRIAKTLQDLTGKLIFHAAGFGSDIQEEIERLKADLEGTGIGLNNAKSSLPEIEQIVSMMTDVESLSETWVQEMTSGSDRISDLVLIDKRTKTAVSHRDVGIGISQVIPILVSCYGLSDALVAIEQPEIHLHPRLQAELGSVFAESIKPPYNNRFILETHSEHLMLRLQKLIREGQLKPEDVSVIYVDSNSEGSQCLELRLDEEGDFIDEWPDGFFEDDFKEIFS